MGLRSITSAEALEAASRKEASPGRLPRLTLGLRLRLRSRLGLGLLLQLGLGLGLGLGLRLGLRLRLRLGLRLWLWLGPMRLARLAGLFLSLWFNEASPTLTGGED